MSVSSVTFNNAQIKHDDMMKLFSLSLSLFACNHTGISSCGCKCRTASRMCLPPHPEPDRGGKSRRPAVVRPQEAEQQRTPPCATDPARRRRCMSTSLLGQTHLQRLLPGAPKAVHARFASTSRRQRACSGAERGAGLGAELVPRVRSGGADSCFINRLPGLPRAPALVHKSCLLWDCPVGLGPYPQTDLLSHSVSITAAGGVLQVSLVCRRFFFPSSSFGLVFTLRSL